VRRLGPLAVESALHIAAQVARALAAAEIHRLVHRDLKPSNIMLVGNEASAADELVVKVIDFGLARNAEASHLLHGGFSGTPEFASPEQFHSAATPLDARSDIYSLGATLYYACTGKVHVASDPEEANVEQLPAAFVRLLRAMLARNPAERPQDARQLLNAIQRARVETDRRQRRRKQRLVTAAVITLPLLSSAGIAAYKLRQRQTAAALIRSVALLPFEELSDERNNAYFVDGIQDDLLSSLAKIKELKVISRTSVMSFRKSGPRNLRAIGKELGAANVLDGSVRRVGNRVVMNVQLIRSRKQCHRSKGPSSGSFRSVPRSTNLSQLGNRSTNLSRTHWPTHCTTSVSTRSGSRCGRTRVFRSSWSRRNS
jgi:serine/threonine protein kinase